ncbi:hypothetical protein ONS95_012649 [Cadophora gregata]|uniref:uncharacterized protein n=1 Tax=Cadophora gregata TaxID=51156 RepID=UPI0026DD81A8|nr:uncharacterized protein ONS95_012649 [Cadophora gregata]KAK0118361.1 hypothetical protein ONS95_012649 [Cadophora gregata]KAK0123430.1 hypothetical protein ONS96_010413 [Cadophora gregata f. sp. sojae]
MHLLPFVALATCVVAVPAQIDILITSEAPEHSNTIHNANHVFEEPSCVAAVGKQCEPWIEGRTCCPGLTCITAYRTMICVEENIFIKSKVHVENDKEKCMPEWKIPDKDENHWLCHLGWDIGTPHPCCDPETSCQKLPYPPIPDEGFGWGCLPKRPDENVS